MSRVSDTSNTSHGSADSNTSRFWATFNVHKPWVLYVSNSRSIDCGKMPERVLQRVSEALQRFEDDPEQLARDRDERFNRSAPPCHQSDITTEPLSHGPAEYESSGCEEEASDWFRERALRREAERKSIAWYQFESQVLREHERLGHQHDLELRGRKQTLPWDDSCDYPANAANNVRSRWVEQGIWGDEWGPAWPKGTKLPWTGGTSDGPFCGSYHPSTLETKPGRRWGHEDTPQRSPGPPARFSFKNCNRKGLPLLPPPTVRNPQASRPLPQYLYQVAREREWLKDEIDYWSPDRIVDLDALAHKSVKEFWTVNGLWIWGDADYPGPSWLHEKRKSDLPGDNGGGQLPDPTTEHGRRAVGDGDGDDEQYPTNGGNSSNGILPGAQAPCMQEKSDRQTRKRVAGDVEETLNGDQEEAAPRRSRRIARLTETSEDNQDGRPTKRRRGGQAMAAIEQPQTKTTRAIGKHSDASHVTAGPRRSERISERNKKAGPVGAEAQLQSSRLQPRKTSGSSDSGETAKVPAPPVKAKSVAASASRKKVKRNP